MMRPGGSEDHGMTETALARLDREVAKLSDIAPGGYLLALRIRGTSPLQAYHTYPQAWIDEYTQSGYMLRDPLMTWALTVGGTIRWSSALLPDPFRIFRKAAAHGLHYGASVAHGPLRALTICSMAHPDREFSDDEIAAAKAITIAAHDASEMPGALPDAEKHLLAAIGRGTGAKAIAADLGLSPADAHEALEALSGKLMARTPQEALRHATEYKLL